MRIIPKTAKVKAEFFKNVTILDVIIAFVGLFLTVMLFLTNLGYVRFILMTICLCIVVLLFIPIDGQRFYLFFVNFVKYLFSIKHYSTEYSNSSTNINNIIPFKGVDGKYIVYKDYFGEVLEIDPREFRLISGFKQDQIIDVYFGRIIRSISGNTKASIVKIDRKLSFKEFMDGEEAKRQELLRLYQEQSITEGELSVRQRIIDDRIRVYQTLQDKNNIEKPFYYLVVYDEQKSVLDEIMDNAINSFLEAGMTSRVIEGKNLGVFLKYTYTDSFNEEDVEFLHDEEFMNWIIPHDIKFTPKSINIDGQETYNFTIRNYPISVMNAWGYQMFNIQGTKVVMNIEPYEKQKAIKMLDRSLQELASQSEQSFKVSSVIDKQTHINTLVNVMRMLQNDNETLFKVNLHFTIYNKEQKNNVKKAIKRILAEDGFEASENFCKQNKAFTSISLSHYDVLEEHARSIHSGSVAAVFPFVLSTIMDKKGVIIGENNGFPVIVDFFKRDTERVNSNMVIMGKSGSGKSFATKTILTHIAAEDTKIFILDPENEYTELVNHMGGRIIDVGTASQGRINPFHVITTLDADEEDSVIDNFSVHLQFLEEFFRVVLPGIDMQALEYLNNLIVELYKTKGIDKSTNFTKLKPSDYPIFDDLFDLINKKYEESTNEYDLTNLRILHNFISKFSYEGRNANLWNGESTLTVKENFTVFNFQSLLANKNGVIANAQMLLVLKWLDNEIIKNRDFNIKHEMHRKIIVAIDEAHVFIDPKYPIALDFMYQLAKRIRKYNGMQIVITQNIKDFVGTQEIVRKSTAIINACQYSFIFSLAPNDMDDLCVLYEKAGQINSTEQDQIINNERGNAFIITSPQSRNNIKIIASNMVRGLFKD